MTPLIFRPEAFAGARLKIERAHEHVRDAERWINAFIDMNIYRFSVDVNPDTGENFIRFSGTWTNPTGSLSTIIGDAIHNLRTSLDYVATEIRRAGGLDVKRRYFPIDDRRESLVSQPGYREIEEIAPDIAAMIADLVEPDGADLVGINQLDRADKHRLLIVSFAQAEGRVLCIADDSDSSALEAGTFLVLPQGRPPSPGSVADIHNQNNNKSAFSITFHEGQPFEGKAVIPTLNQLAQLTAGVVEKLATYCIARKP